MNIEELKETLSEQELTEIQEYQYNTELLVENAIERVQEYNTEIDRLTNLYNEKIEQIKQQFEFKLEKLKKQKQWEEFNLQNAVLQAEDKKETKTQFKKSFLSGDIIVKKERKKLLKPKVDEDVIKSQFADYKKDKVELDWKTMSKELVVTDDNRVINKSTGEDLTGIVEIEQIPMKVEVK